MTCTPIAARGAGLYLTLINIFVRCRRTSSVSPLPRSPIPRADRSLTRLAEGEATVNELAEPFAVSLPAISRHLQVLERAGLIVPSRKAQRRPSRMQAEPLDDAVEWMQSRTRTWEERMDRLDAHPHPTREQRE